MRRLALLAAIVLGACRPSQQQTVDSAAPRTTSAVTVKPDTVGLATPPADTTAAKARGASPVVKQGATKSTRRAPSTTTARDTHHLGRDSVIYADPRDPRHQLPTVPRKPPQ